MTSSCSLGQALDPEVPALDTPTSSEQKMAARCLPGAAAVRPIAQVQPTDVDQFHRKLTARFPAPAQTLWTVPSRSSRATGIYGSADNHARLQRSMCTRPSRVTRQ